jgi:hypothetical protein
MATEKQRRTYLKKTYGLSPETYTRMMAFNASHCHICSRAPKTGKHLNVDHDHKTGQKRGLLCFYCNKYMIGRRRKEHAWLFESAANYLRRAPTWGTTPHTTGKRKKK